MKAEEAIKNAQKKEEQKEEVFSEYQQQVPKQQLEALQKL